MAKKNKMSPGLIVVYVILIIWALTTVYPILWVIQNAFKAKNKILENSFALPLGDLFTTANFRKAFDTTDISGRIRAACLSPLWWL